MTFILIYFESGYISKVSSEFHSDEELLDVASGNDDSDTVTFTDDGEFQRFFNFFEAVTYFIFCGTWIPLADTPHKLYSTRLFCSSNMQKKQSFYPR